MPLWRQWLILTLHWDKTNNKNTLQQAVSKISILENEASCNCNNSNDDDFYKNLEGASSAPNNEWFRNAALYLQDTSRALSPTSLGATIRH